MEPRFNEPLFNEVLDITNPQFNEQYWSVPSDFIKSRFLCIEILRSDETFASAKILELPFATTSIIILNAVASSLPLITESYNSEN